MWGATDERGQSHVVGALLIFVIIIAGLGVLQVYLVPQVVSDTEHRHAEQIDSEFTGIYSAALDAAGANYDRSVAITLGTSYDNIPGLIMPPSKAGTLSSAEVGTLEADGGERLDDDVLSTICGVDTVSSKAIQYRVNYHQYGGSGMYTYETSTKYKAVGGRAVRSEQRLIDVTEEGTLTTINLVPITHGQVQASGTSAESIVLHAGATGKTNVFQGSSSDPVEITIPVSHQVGWQKAFDGIEDISVNSGEATLQLDNESRNYQIRCTPVGLNTRPNNTPADLTVDEEENDGAFNPIGQGELVLQSSDQSELVFENLANTEKTVTEVRIPWTFGLGGSGDEFELRLEGDDPDSETVTVPTQSNDWTSLQAEIGKNWRWTAQDEPDNVKSVYIENDPFPDAQNGNDAGYALVFKFDDGTTSTYMISGGTGG